MTILYISIDSAWGENTAASIHTYSLAKAMAALGNKVYVITTGSGNNVVEGDITYIRVRTYVLSGNPVKMLFKFAWNNILITYNALTVTCDLVYERHNIGIFSGIIISFLKRRKLFYEVNVLSDEEIVQSHHIRSLTLKNMLRRISRFQLTKAAQIFVQTKELQSAVSQSYKIDNIKVIENGVNINSKKPRKKKMLQTFIYVGSIDEYHSLDKILDTFSKMSPKYDLIIVGTGEKLSRYQSKYRLHSNINFLGSLPHAEALRQMEQADVGIAHYNVESPLFRKFGFYFCPLKLLEYSSLAVPSIIIGESNSFIKIFEDANACIVLNEVEQLGSTLINIIGQPRLISRMSNNAWETVQQFSWETTAKRTLKEFYG